MWQAEVDPDETLKTPKRLQSIGGEMWSYLFGSEASEMMAPRQLEKTPLELHPIETTIEQAMQDVGTLKEAQWENYDPHYIGPWNFWHQSLGSLPDLGAAQ